MAISLQVVMDCHDPSRLTAFWATTLGYKLQDPPSGFDSWPAFLAAQGVPADEWNSASAIVDPEGQGPRIYFQRVPEPKTVKNRLHLDVNASGSSDLSPDERRARIDTAVERLVKEGATRLRTLEQRDEYWVVLADPEGNEFCVQ